MRKTLASVFNAAITCRRGGLSGSAIAWLQRPAVFAVMCLALLALGAIASQAVLQGSFVWAAAWLLAPLALVVYLVFAGLEVCIASVVALWCRRTGSASSLLLLLRRRVQVRPVASMQFIARARDSIP